MITNDCTDFPSWDQVAELLTRCFASLDWPATVIIPSRSVPVAFVVYLKDERNTSSLTSSTSSFPTTIQEVGATQHQR